jgi:hypothetical protein
MFHVETALDDEVLIVRPAIATVRAAANTLPWPLVDAMH